MLERRPGDPPPRSLYLKGLPSAGMTLIAVFMLMAVAEGYSPRDALVPVLALSAVFTPVLILPLVYILGPAQGTARVRPTTSVHLGGTYDDVFDRCVEAVASVEGFRVVRANRARGKIVARVAPTWASFGERICLKVRPQPTGAEVWVSSRPRVPGTVIDQGKNELNLEVILGRLTESALGPVARPQSALRGAPGPPLSAMAVAGAVLVLQLTFSVTFRRAGTGHLWFALANLGFVLAFFGSALHAVRRAGASSRVRGLLASAAVLTIAGQFVVWTR